MTLTALDVKNAKGREKPYKLSDQGGLYLYVTPNGGRLWRLSYRFAGRRKLLALGRVPDVGLADAREARDAAKVHLARGVDPSEHRKSIRRAAAAAAENSFERIAREWLGSIRPQWSARYAALVEARFVNDVFPVIGHLPISKIDGPTLLQMLRRIEGRGAVEFSHRIRAHCGNIFRYAIADGRAKYDPSKDIADAQARPAPVVHRAKIPASGMPTFFARLALDEGHELSHLALRWTILTWVRTQETRFADKAELEGLDTDAPIWRIPPERMKMDNEHIVPLSRQAAALLPRILELSGRSQWLFPVPGTKTGVISENRMLDCMYRMGYRGKATVHGFRGLASTWANEETRVDEFGETVRRFDSDWIERQLAHVERDEVRSSYNAAEWIGPRRRMLQAWADWLDEQERIGRLLG